MNKFLTGLCIAGSLVLGLTAPADAQRISHMAAFSRTAFHTRPDALKVNINGFYHPYVYPQIGIVVHTLPVGYYSFVWNTYPYYYCDGLFYQSYADGSLKLLRLRSERKFLRCQLMPRSSPLMVIHIMNTKASTMNLSFILMEKLPIKWLARMAYWIPIARPTQPYRWWVIWRIICQMVLTAWL